MFAALLARVPSPPPAHGLVNAAWSRVSTHALGIAERFRRAQCGLVGHAMVLQFEPHRMSLRCMHCGEQTPGWALHDSRELRLLGMKAYAQHRAVSSQSL